MRSESDSAPATQSRREFVKRAAYVAPAVLTLNAVSATAKAGSGPPPNTPPTTVPGGPPSPLPGRRR